MRAGGRAASAGGLDVWGCSSRRCLPAPQTDPHPLLPPPLALLLCSYDGEWQQRLT